MMRGGRGRHRKPGKKKALLERYNPARVHPTAGSRIYPPPAPADQARAAG
ncbi:MAG: hypothetical protein P8168_10345 [Deltaproteobacteria bacterium]